MGRPLQEDECRGDGTEQPYDTCRTFEEDWISYRCNVCGAIVTLPNPSPLDSYIHRRQDCRGTQKEGE